MLPHHYHPRVSEESLKGPRASPTGESTSFPTMQLSGFALARLGERSAVGTAFSRRRPEEPGSRAWTGDREAKQPQRTDMAETDPKTVQDLTAVVQTLLQQMQDKFQIMSDQIIGRIDDMSCRIDDLEKNIADLMTQAGVEELEGGENKAATTKTSTCQ